MIDAVHHGGIDIGLRGLAEQYPRGPGGEVALGAGPIAKRSRAFQHRIHTDIAPVQALYARFAAQDLFPSADA